MYILSGPKRKFYLILHPILAISKEGCLKGLTNIFYRFRELLISYEMNLELKEWNTNRLLSQSVRYQAHK